MVNPNNNVSEINQNRRIYEIYPYGSSSFMEYDDDGITTGYADGQCVKTPIESVLDGDDVNVIVHSAKGHFKGFVKEKETEFRINVTSHPKKVMVRMNGKKVRLKSVKSMEDFNAGRMVTAAEAIPVYLRNEVAKKPKPVVF